MFEDMPSLAIPKATVGAASELRACAELMRLGFHVFRSESPHAPFDLVAYRDGEIMRVEVKTLRQQGTFAPSFTFPRNNEYDVLCLVAPERFFFFDSSLTPDEVRSAVRVAYGLQPVYDNWEYPPCGTTGGAGHHRARGEAVCEACEAAEGSHRARWKIPRGIPTPRVSQDQASERGTDATEPQNGAEAVACVINAARAWVAEMRRLGNGGPILGTFGQSLAEAVDALNNHHSDPIDGVRELALRAATAEALRKADLQTLERWAPVVEAAKTWWNAAYGEDGDEQRALGQAVAKLNAAEDGHG